MLVLTRQEGQSIVIGQGIEVFVKRIDRSRVSIAIRAPRETPVRRGELRPLDSRNMKEAG